MQSLTVVLLTGFFTGAVLALQSGLTLDQFGARPFVGRLVSASMIKELGPVLTALMLTGRIGSGIAAELGSMVVTDQISALRALGTDPVRKLVVPRLLAGFFMAPVLTVIADFVGITGGWLVARFKLQVETGLYWSSVLQGLYMQDIWMGLIKPFILGFVIVTIACHVGLRTTGGTQGVGKSTTVSVVAGSVALIFADYLVTQILIALLYSVMAETTAAPTEATNGVSPNDGIAVEFKHVSLAFDEKVILKDVSFTLPRGRTKIILGASGAGKSVTLKILLGLLKPDSGEVWVNGRQIDTLTEDQMMEVRADLGMVFQEGALFDSLTVRENVGYKLYEETRMPLEEVDTRVQEVLGFVGLGEFIDRMPVGPLGRPAAPGRDRTGDGGQAKNSALRRSDDGPRPHHGHDRGRRDDQAPGLRRGVVHHRDASAARCVLGGAASRRPRRGREGGDRACRHHERARGGIRDDPQRPGGL